MSTYRAILRTAFAHLCRAPLSAVVLALFFAGFVSSEEGLVDPAPLTEEVEAGQEDPVSDEDQALDEAAEETDAAPEEGDATPATTTTALIQTRHRDDIILSNEHAVLELHTMRGALRHFRLRGVHPIVLPDHFLEEGEEHLDTESYLAVLGEHNRPGAQLHNWLSGVPGQGLDAPWEIESHSDTRVVFRHAEPELGLLYRLEYRLRPDRPTADVTLLVENLADEAQELTPAIFLINGIHQDVGSNESWHLTFAEHRGGSAGDLVRRDAFPAPGEAPIVSLVDEHFDYAALKSRFFVAFWQPQHLRIGEGLDFGPLPEQRQPDRQPAQAGGPDGEVLTGGPDALLPSPSVEPLRGASTAHRIQFSLRGFEQGSRGPNPKRQGLLSAQYYGAEAEGAPLRLQPGESLRIAWSLSISSMRKVDLVKLDATERRMQYTNAFHRFFRVLSDLLTWVLGLLAAIPGVGYGLGVVLLTIMLKAALYRTTYKQQKSMLAMQKLGPELKRIQEQYKNDPQTRNTKTMELWRKHGVNPLGGCLPIFIQMPIFISLYQAFSHVAELRGEGFLWIADLTLPDQVWHLGQMAGFTITINILPILYMAVSLLMTFANKPASTSGNDQSAQMMKMMRWMPMFFGFIFYNMPSGLVLYFTMSALISAIEIRWIRHQLGADKK